MRVCFTAPSSNYMINAGSNVQLQKTALHLKELGVDVEFFDQWKSYDHENIDLFHMFNANFTTYDLARRFNDMNYPFVVSSIFYTLHNPLFIKSTIAVEKFTKRIFKGLWTDYGVIKEICDWSKAILPNTSEEANLIEKGFDIPVEKVNVIPNGVDKRFYNADSSLFYKTYGIKDFILYVGMIGSFRKNILSLIRAVKNIDHPVVLIGKIFKNPYAEKCLQEAAKNKNILIIDSIPQDSKLLESAYAACHTFVLPAYFETPGIAALEAGLAGANIVNTKHGGTKDYFADQAVYIDPASVKSIKNGLIQSLNKPKDKALQKCIMDNYLWEQVAKKTAEIYNKVLSSK